MYFLYASTAIALRIDIGAVTTWRTCDKQLGGQLKQSLMQLKIIKKLESDDEHCVEAPTLCETAFAQCKSSPYDANKSKY